MSKDKKSFFERLTGAMRMDDEMPEHIPAHSTGPMMHPQIRSNTPSSITTPPPQWGDEAEGQLTVDVYQTPDDIIIKTMVAGVKPEDLDVNIARDMVTIKGSREHLPEESADFFHQELYWGSFSRTIMLPEEVDIEGVEANEKYGLLTIRLPKIDKHRQTKVRVKSQM
jgi:HSP20 family protein